jgi:folylpolyglutamate synthase/dihydropteroate synthase
VTFEEAERYLLSLELFGMRFGLDRMRRLMTALGHPERQFKSIHVVGTNGKSSTVRMIAAILSHHGLSTGSYLSPHLISFTERIRIDDADLQPNEFAAAVARAARAAEMVDRSLGADDRVTQFEALTAAAYSELAERGVEVAVIEAGLGGRYDATNVIPSSVQVLTSVGLEHTRWLGPTITDIAKRAGVSISTVSYALSGRRPISEATRKRIFAAIEELDFRPNPVGRALASKRSQTIAILHPTRSHVMSEMPLEFLISAASAAARRNYSLLLATSPNEDEELVRLIGQGFIDGLILMEVKLDDARIPLLRQHGYHFSMIGHCRDNDGLSFVDFDFEHGLGLAVDYLTELGHPQVALVSRQQSLHDAGYGPSVRAIDGLILQVEEEPGT